MGADIPALSKNFKTQSCPSDLPMYDSGIHPTGTKASFAQVIAAAAPHARIVHFGDTDHTDRSVSGVMAEQSHLDALRNAGFTDIAIEAPQDMQHWNDKLADGALTRQEFEAKIHPAFMATQGNENGDWTRQLGKTAAYARDHGMKFHFADPENGSQWCDQNLSEEAFQSCERANTLDRYDDTGALGSSLRDPGKGKIFLIYGSAHFSLDNGSREAAGGSYLKIDVYKNRQAYEGDKDIFKEDHANGIPVNQLKPDLIYLIDEQQVYTTCQTASALRSDIDAITPESATSSLPPPTPLHKPSMTVR